MKLSLSLLKKYIHLNPEHISNLRHTLSDLGLEVEEELEEGSETFFKIETLAHRGDHLYAEGVARELSARYLIPTTPPKIVSEIPAIDLPLEITVEAPSCLRYALMSMEASLPIVDLLNSIHAEIGQPLHAFDRACVEGPIRVITSTKEEEIVALDANTYRVPSGSILISDSKKILAVAGVIGCQNSMVTAQTKNVLVESASFDPVTIRKTAKKMGISTDASYLFERGCDREKVLLALKMVLALLPQKGKVGLYYYPGKPTPKRTFTLSLSRLHALLNAYHITREEVEKRLMFLGYEISSRDADHVKISPPSWREWNVLSETTIIEDFARTFGLNSLPLSLPALDYTQAPLHKNEILMQKIEKNLLGNGFFEVVTKSYYSQEAVFFLNKLQEGVDAQHIAIKNSVESEYSHLKVTNIIHLARLSEYSFRRGIHSFKVFELARLFSPHQKKSSFEHERDVLSLAVAGRWHEGEWKSEETRETKIQLFKGILESLHMSLNFDVEIKESKDPFLHPGYQACLYVQGVKSGHFGLIHPQLKSRLQLEHDLLYAEFDVAVLTNSLPLTRKVTFSDFPSIRRDLTLKVPKKTLATNVIETIVAFKPKFLQEISIVNVFQKEGEDFRRVTYRLSFQSENRTLQHEEVDSVTRELLLQLKDSYELCV